MGCLAQREKDEKSSLKVKRESLISTCEGLTHSPRLRGQKTQERCSRGRKIWLRKKRGKLKKLEEGTSREDIISTLLRRSKYSPREKIGGG